MNQTIGNINNSKVTEANINIANNTDKATNSTSHINRKSNCAIGLSILSIVASLGAWVSLYLTILQDKDATSSDAFIGAIGGLMGICATIIVGFQIYNSVDINLKMKETNSLYNDKFNLLSVKQRDLENLISKTKQNLEETKLNNQNSLASIQSYVRIVQAMIISEKQPFSAFYSWYCAMKYAVNAKDDKIIKLIIANLENLYSDIEYFDNKTIGNYLKNDDYNNIKMIISINLKNMPTNETYKEVQDRFEKIVSDIIQKVTICLEEN